MIKSATRQETLPLLIELQKKARKRFELQRELDRLVDDEARYHREPAFAEAAYR